ncbi:MAG: hypothetical protein PHF86_04975 [Candidatus Nanoarchaeia archaeon]|nr:hypothetical protein [Candidatus Nanoarchaeia archaeon]
MPRTRTGKPKRNIWKDSSPYGTYNGEAGNPEQWAQAFNFIKMSREQALQILQHGESPHIILGVSETATVTEIRKAMARLVLKYRQGNFSHDASNANDKNRAMFDKVMAAYMLLSDK